MNTSNYHILYFPRPRMGCKGFNVEFTMEFARFARDQKINIGGVEARAQEAVSTLMRLPPRSPMLGFDGGLLWKIELPGANAPGMSLEQYWEEKEEAEYTPRNIDNAEQAATLLCIMTQYINSIEYAIPEKQE